VSAARITTDVRFAIIPEWVLFAPISPGAVRLYGVLARHADKDQHFAIVGRAKLAEQMRCSPDTVDRALAELVRIKAVSVTHRIDPDNLMHNLPSGYNLHVTPEGIGTDAHTPIGVDTGGGKDAHTRVQASVPLPARVPRGKDAAQVPREVLSKNQHLKQDPKPLSELERSDVAALCSLLADLVEANGSPRPKVSEAWGTQARLLLDAGSRTLEEAEAVLRWCQANDFWRGNVLSMPKFREKYDQLRLAMARGSPRPTGRGRAAEIWENAEAMERAGL
jgi:hypothetical protein